MSATQTNDTGDRAAILAEVKRMHDAWKAAEKVTETDKSMKAALDVRAAYKAYDKAFGAAYPHIGSAA